MGSIRSSAVLSNIFSIILKPTSSYPWCFWVTKASRAACFSARSSTKTAVPVMTTLSKAAVILLGMISAEMMAEKQHLGSRFRHSILYP